MPGLVPRLSQDWTLVGPVFPSPFSEHNTASMRGEHHAKTATRPSSNAVEMASPTLPFSVLLPVSQLAERHTTYVVATREELGKKRRLVQLAAGRSLQEAQYDGTSWLVRTTRHGMPERAALAAVSVPPIYLPTGFEPKDVSPHVQRRARVRASGRA
jgi:hypothetical protein